MAVQLTSSRVRFGQSFKTVGYGCASCWGDVGAGSVEADVFYIPFIVSVQYIGYQVPYRDGYKYNSGLLDNLGEPWTTEPGRTVLI